MPIELESTLVVGVASSALFDLTESDAVYREQGEDAYRDYQQRHLDDTLSPGVAYPFIKRLLSLNDLSPAAPLVEVIILSRNDPETGLRVMRSVEARKLAITRAVFMQGRSPYSYMPAFNMTLFLSANESDVREAIAMGLPAGRVMGSPVSDSSGTDLRIAFDFDGVLADDASEMVYASGDLAAFQQHELDNAGTPLQPGLMRGFLQAVNRIQRVEDEMASATDDYNRRLHVSIVTARSAPAHDRVIATLKSWGVRVNDAFFLGGIGKEKVLAILKPHIFFDDQLRHIESTAAVVPSVHVPFGVRNLSLAVAPEVREPSEPSLSPGRHRKFPDEPDEL